MAANVINYKGLQVVDNAQNDTGKNLTTNFQKLVDNIPKTNITTTNPTVNSDTSAGYDTMSRWLNTATDAIYHCVDPKVGAAQWVRQNVLSVDSNPTLSADLDCGSYAIKGNIASDTTTALFTVAGDVKFNKPVDFQGRSLQRIDSILFSGGHTITANEIRIESTWNSDPEEHKVKIGPIRWSNRPGFNRAALATLASSGDTQWGCVPVGTIIPWAGPTVPRWCLLCDGAAVSRTVYARLFSIIGTNFGTGDGSTTFNVPNVAGRVPVGKSTSNNFNAYGQRATTYVGEKTHALTEAEIPGHSHSIQSYQSYSGGCYPRGWGTNYNSCNAYNTCTGTGGTCAGAAHPNLPPYNTVMWVVMVGS